MKTMKEYKSMRAENGQGKGTVLANEDGAVIFVVLMVLVTLTVIAIVSSDSQITENLIVRNLAIRKQNVYLLDSALMRGYQEFMQIPADVVNATANFAPNAGPNALWINNINNDPPGVGSPEEFINTIWYEDIFTRRCLFPGNSRVENTVPLLTTRGENGNNGLRYAIVGWRNLPMASNSQKPNQPLWYGGRLIAEYVSVDAGGNANGFGILRQEMGLRRQWIP
jgi:hypothetical protein